jgi:hypothetical protein
MKKFQKFINELKYRRDNLFILIMPKAKMGNTEIKTFCHQQGIDYLDYREEIITSILPGQTSGIIQFDFELERIRKLSNNYSGKVLLLYNFDLILSYFDYDNLKLFWKQLYSHFPNLETIFGLPITLSSELLPHNFNEWHQDNRVFTI